MSDLDEQEPLMEPSEKLCAEMLARPQAGREFREALLERTCAAVRSRPRRRRLLIACCVCLAYVAGIATVTLWTRGPTQAPETDITQIAQTETLASGPDEPESLLARVPEVSRSEQIRLLARALYCYRQVLELAPSSQLVAVDQDDSWLLASLKLARIQETTHENQRS
jgi:negative regulator of sigma E activity